MTNETSLTDHERKIIARARELATTKGSAELRVLLAGDITPSTPDDTVHPIAFGVAQFYLAELADLAERLAGEAR